MAITWDRARWAFVAGVTLLLLIAGAAGIMIVRIQNTNRRIMRAFEIQMALENLESTMSAAGRARMLYMASSNDQYLQESNSKIADAQAHMNSILQQTEDIAAHEAYYRNLSDLLNRRIAIDRASLADIQAGTRDPVAQGGYANQIATLGDAMSTAIREMEAHEEQFANQRRIVSQRLFAAIVSILAAGFAFSIGLLYLNYRFLRVELGERRRAEQSALESQEAMRLLSVRLIRAQDEQSRKFSRELHDSLGQYLSLAKMNLGRYIRTRGTSADPTLTETLEMLDRCIAEGRTISYLLHPPMLDEMGFHFAARWYLEGFSKRSGIQVNANIPEDSERLPIAIEVTLFRVLQECLTNIHRHSGSNRADVTLTASPAEAVLRVRDYGGGIPSHVLHHFFANGGQVGVGLAGMRERVREQGGQLDIESNAAGTTVTVRIPAAALATSAVVAD